MPCVRSKQRITDQITRAIEAVDADAVLVHSDIAPIGYLPQPFSRQRVLDDLLQALLAAADGRTLMMPAFNYDFPATGIYNVLSDTVQVGALNQHMRNTFPHLRTCTPVFNVCMNRPDSRFPLEATDDILGAGSIFAHLRAHGGVVAFLGTDLGANTFFHHMEEVADVPYRYVKRFNGCINTGDERPDQPITVRYRVRPRVTGAAILDIPRLQDDLTSSGILSRHPVGNAYLYTFRADTAAEYWQERLQENPHHLLTAAARNVADDLYEAYGTPLIFERVEG